MGNETPAAPSPAAVGMRPAERGVGDGFDGPAGDPKRLPGPALVLVWAPRHKGTRSGWLARALGIGDPVYVA
ncbi:MAG TPA: hypothetical protein VNJ28_08820, partial [Candidatus Limnocylindrales bacterium]|nr:hypothetical protein [Candidatus Limnocylindrales bacterium]